MNENLLTLVQGPPGTGKTHTICNIINKNLRRMAWDDARKEVESS